MKLQTNYFVTICQSTTHLQVFYDAEYTGPDGRKGNSVTYTLIEYLGFHGHPIAGDSDGITELCKLQGENGLKLEDTAVADMKRYIHIFYVNSAKLEDVVMKKIMEVTKQQMNLFEPVN